MSKFQTSMSLAAGIVALTASAGIAFADDTPAHADEHGTVSAAQLSQLCRIDIRGDKKEQWMRLPKAESSVTQHHFGGGKGFDYTATAGTLIVRDDDDRPMASIGYVAYTAQGRRPWPADHLRLQRRPGILLAVAAHGSAGPQARDRLGPGADPGGSLPHGRQRVRGARQE